MEVSRNLDTNANESFEKVPVIFMLSSPDSESMRVIVGGGRVLRVSPLRYDSESPSQRFSDQPEPEVVQFDNGSSGYLLGVRVRRKFSTR